MEIEIPEFSLIALIGASSSGKSTFAGKHFLKTEVLSSDFFRAMICDDETDQSVSPEAFELLYSAAEKRLALGKRTVIDATNLQPSDRKRIIELSRAYDVHAAAIVLDVEAEELLRRNASRADRNLSEKVIRKQHEALRKSIRSLKKEGFRFTAVLKDKEIDSAEIVYSKLWNDKREMHGPFDVIGDIHGCAEELEELLQKLGYVKDDSGSGAYRNPDGRIAVFLGDLTDRGPGNADTLRLVMGMVKSGAALCVPGNHENKLGRYLKGKNVRISNGLEETVRELDREDESFRKEVREFIDSLVSHYRLDGGKLVVTHAGIRQEYIGRASMRIREFCLYGDVNGEKDDLGLPVRLDWAREYHGEPLIVYGHVPSAEVYALNNTYCIDTGCVFGGKLTCFRYPERDFVSVPAKKQYAVPARPLKQGTKKEETGQRRQEEVFALDAADLTGKLRIETSLISSIVIREEQSAAAMEEISRFAVDPRWLIYLPPTMSPCETSEEPDYLEYPAEAFRYYAKNGIRQVVCEKKHMGSRAVIVLCRNSETARESFGIDTGEKGIVYTRTGKRFFNDRKMEEALLERLGMALSETGFWEDFQTGWVCLDTEIMPWSEKALSLIRTQYGPIGRAGRETLSASSACIEKAYERLRNPELEELQSRYREKQYAMDQYIKAYREYCWDVKDISDLSVAPFHLLATEGKVHSDKDHVWHMEILKKYCTGTDPVFTATDYRLVDTEDEASVRAGIEWWLSLTASGGEGMVVKPASFVSWNGEKLVQPAVKCRGREYLRIIYGPEYLEKEHLQRLKKRSLKMKRKLALREFALGLEALQQFVNKDTLKRVHRCVFCIVALESEEVDPRL